MFPGGLKVRAAHDAFVVEADGMASVDPSGGNEPANDPPAGQDP